MRELSSCLRRYLTDSLSKTQKILTKSFLMKKLPHAMFKARLASKSLMQVSNILWAMTQMVMASYP